MKKLRLELETVEVLSFATTRKVEALQAGFEARQTVWWVSRCGFSCEGGSVCCET